MLISDMIKRLEELKEKHGNIEIFSEHSELECPPECGYGMPVLGINIYSENLPQKGLKNIAVIMNGYFHTRCSHECSRCETVG